MVHGFIGTGTIAEAMIAGLLASTLAIDQTVVSPRNAEVAARLARRFAEVKVAASNQVVADQAELLVLAVRPQVAKDVLEGLSVPAGRTVVSLIAATERESVARWIACDAASVVRAIPLPFIAHNDGVTAVYPSDPEIVSLFGALGSVVACDSKHEFDLLAAASSLMGTHFGLMERTAV